MDNIESQNYPKWECKYHVVFIQKIEGMWRTPSLITATSGTVRYGPACPVVWQEHLPLWGTPYADFDEFNMALGNPA